MDIILRRMTETSAVFEDKFNTDEMHNGNKLNIMDTMTVIMMQAQRQADMK